MLRVLLVDDEPFILQGLKVLFDWETEGFEIVKTAGDGEEALKYLKEQQVDLIIADINMPGINGLELLEKIRGENISDAYFVFLSGYADFSYAQKAISYECTYYLLKPVEKEELLKVLKKVLEKNEKRIETIQTSVKMERAYLARNMISVILGKYDSANLEYVKDYTRFSDFLYYVEIELDGMQLEDEITDQEKREYQRKLFQSCLDFLKEDGNHCIFDVSGHEKIYDVGFVFCDYMAHQEGMTESKYLEYFQKYLQDAIGLPVIMLVGKKVNDISQIAKSYRAASMLRSFQGFHSKKNIYYYEEDIQVTNTGIVLCKQSLDQLVQAVEQNNSATIIKGVSVFFEEMQSKGLSEKIINLNINYLLFQLIHLATEQDDGINQEEILRMISESTFDEGIMRGSKAHITRFACEYGDYLTQLRKKVSRGVLSEVEKEVQEHYADNLTLKDLSEKYYVNSAYLGQLFRKKYGQSFKDYLNAYRIEQAATRLLRTDDKIYCIAEAVGYHDPDYFVNRFIAQKGCTPARFRKQAQEQRAN